MLDYVFNDTHTCFGASCRATARKKRLADKRHDDRGTDLGRWSLDRLMTMPDLFAGQCSHFRFPLPS